ncbi:Gfo/Idh/MocA family oxidoreductase [Streptomyces sp. NPDC050856]|uniref:Gfo/Idh/MocA family oxidoreductase n=1 Tax=Streptomyces sp. NPDC050856 TaxID=3154939 RepID=UPI0033CD6EB4
MPGERPSRAPAAVPARLLDSGPLRTVIVGYGRAGRELHHAALREAAATGPADLYDSEVTAVDPRRPDELPAGTRWLAGLDELARRAPADPGRTVFHLATPPGGRLPLLRALLALGARAVVVEKPFARTHAEARRMVAAARSAGARLIPVTVWPSSEVTHRVERELAAIGPLRHLSMDQSKPRPPRPGDLGDGHRSALDVEMPHQLLLALHLAGPVREIAEASVRPLPDGEGGLPGFGGARLVLHHRSGVRSELVSDFTVTRRRRSLTAHTAHGWVRAGYPLGAERREGTLASSRLPIAEVVPDRPLTRFLADTYRYLAGRSPAPPAATDTALHVHACALLESAARTAGLGPAPGEPPPDDPYDSHDPYGSHPQDDEPHEEAIA